MGFLNNPGPCNQLLVNNHPIQNVKNCKYLGITIDHELKWTFHIDNTYKKLLRYTSIFYKLRNKLPHSLLKDIYYSFIHSHLLYGIEIYANTNHTYLDKLIKLNNKLLRILQNKPISTHICDLYKSYNTLLIPDLHKQQLLIFVHKSIHHPNMLPEIFTNYFKFNEQFHYHNTRTKANIHLFHFNKSMGHRSTKYKAAVLWNELPSTLQEIESLSLFKRTLKDHFLSQYY